MGVERNMNHEELKDKLLTYFKNSILYNESIDEIDGDESLIDSGYIDSTGIIGLVAFMEKTFGIRVYDNEIIPENFDSLNSIYAYICSKVEKVNSVGMGR